MTQITETINAVREAAERVGLAEFARVADVPYTTVKSFADRGWSHKNFEVLQKLAEAARKLKTRTDKTAPRPQDKAA